VQNADPGEGSQIQSQNAIRFLAQRYKLGRHDHLAFLYGIFGRSGLTAGLAIVSRSFIGRCISLSGGDSSLIFPYKSTDWRSVNKCSRPALGDRVPARSNSGIEERREHLRVSIPAKNRIHDCQPCCSGDIAEDVI
jgi:hypothetical protein